MSDVRCYPSAMAEGNAGFSEDLEQRPDDIGDIFSSSAMSPSSRTRENWLPESDTYQGKRESFKPLIFYYEFKFEEIVEHRGRKRIVLPGTVLPRTIPAKVPTPPQIQTLLNRAYAFKDRLDKTAGLTRDALANEVGINPSYLTRILNLLNLAPEIQQYILAMPPITKSVPITESRIKRLARNEDHKFQIQEFEKLLTLNKPFAAPIQNHAPTAIIANGFIRKKRLTQKKSLCKLYLSCARNCEGGYWMKNKKPVGPSALAALLMLAMMPLPARAIEFQGFMNTDYVYSPSEGANQNLKNGGFVLGGLDLFAAHNFTDHLDVLSEIVFEAPAGSMIVDLERIEVGYAVAEWMNIRLGRFHTPVGYYTNIYHHGRNLDSAIGRPLILEFEDAGGLVPAHTVGPWIRGNLRIIPGVIKYNVGITNGSSIDADAQELTINMASDDNKDKAAFGNLTYEFPCGFGLGSSVYAAKVNGYTAAGGTTAVIDVDQKIVSGHIYYDTLPIQFIAEYYAILNKDVLADPNVDYKSYGYFVQAAYEFKERYRPYFRYDEVKPAGGDVYAVNLGVPDRITRSTYGIMLRIATSSSIKLEGIVETRGGQKADIYGFQWSYEF